MMKKDCFDLMSDEEVILNLEMYKKWNHIHIGELAKMIGCCRETLSIIFKTGQIGTHTRKLANNWLRTNLSVNRTVIVETTTRFCMQNISNNDPLYTELSKETISFALSFEKQLRHISSENNSEKRIDEIKRLHQFMIS